MRTGDSSYYLYSHNDGSRRYESGQNARRSSLHSRSSRCNQKQSPYLPRHGNKHFSNPLFPNDPLLQYTQLYTTHSSPYPIRRSQSGAGPYYQVGSAAGDNSVRHSVGNKGRTKQHQEQALRKWEWGLWWWKSAPQWGL